ncbi:hypothetical protein BCR42DRAFT_428861, partial [Absidia repens]
MISSDRKSITDSEAHLGSFLTNHNLRLAVGTVSQLVDFFILFLYTLQFII